MKEIEGNLLDLFDQKQFDLIAHQANCFHTMGAGIAAQIKQRYPEAYAADLTTNYGDFMKLGTWSSAHIKQGSILNIYSEFDFPQNRLHTIYDALGLAFMKINRVFKGDHIGLPLIGCGIAGGEWEFVKYLIDTRLKDMQVTIVHFKP